MMEGKTSRRTPPFPHHKYFIKVVSKFFRQTDMFSILTNDHFKTFEQIRVGNRHGCYVPRCLLLDPTSSCNLHCTGCWAAGYDVHENLSYETLDDILTQAEELKIGYCFLSGGEPLMRKADLLKLCGEHRRICFSAFTNGLLIDEAFADRIAELGNFTVAISVEGFREETDFRRGQGVYDKAIRAMDILKDRDIEFAFSACYHSRNYKVVASDEFLDHMYDKGCRMGWLFTYIPVGNDADLSLVCTPEQRAYVRDRINLYNNKRRMTIIDFWNNGHLAAGCVAASTGFVHINARGDIEPCAFCHYSDRNIHTTPLKEALRSPFFKAFRDAQPFSGNPLRSCPLIDMPGKLIEVVEQSGARSTEISSPEEARELAAKTLPIAQAWGVVADDIYRTFPRSQIRRFNTHQKILGYKKRKT
ncbi:MAG: radical SAM protein [Saccharofermentanales bacterium]